MRKVIAFILTIATSTFVADLTWAETIKLRREPSSSPHWPLRHSAR
jgi:hypothetical protein